MVWIFLIAGFVSEITKIENISVAVVVLIVWLGAMKYILLLLTLWSASASAYTIGGAYVQLLSCSWGQYGYEYGYIGTYQDTGGKIYQVYFGSNYCQH